MPDGLALKLPKSDDEHRFSSHFYRTISVVDAIFGKADKSTLLFFKSSLKHLKYTLQNWAYSQMLSRRAQEVHKSSQDILKSSQKDEKALPKHLLRLYFRAFSGLSTLYFPFNLNLYDFT